MAKLDIQPLDIQPLDIRPLDIQPIEEDAPFLERAGTGIQQAFGGALNTMDTGVSLAASLPARLFEGEEAQDEIFKNLNKRVAERKEWGGKKDPGFVGKAIGLGASLPLQLLNLGLSPAETGKTFLDEGETLGKAYGAAGIDALGNAAGIMLPGAMGTKVLGKVASGAGINAAQDALTRSAISALADKKSTKDIFDPTWETTGLAALLGGAMGPLSPTTKKPSNRTSVNERLNQPSPADVAKAAEDAKVKLLGVNEDVWMSPEIRQYKERALALQSLARKGTTDLDPTMSPEGPGFKPAVEPDPVIRVDTEGGAYNPQMDAEVGRQAGMERMVDELDQNFMRENPDEATSPGAGLDLIKAIEDLEANSPIDSARPPGIRRGRGPSRGGIDPDLLTGGISKLIDNFKKGNNQEWLNTFVSEKLYPNKTDPDSVLAAAKAEGPEKAGNFISRPTHYAGAGGTLEGMKRDSAIVTGTARIVQRANNIGEDKIRTNVFPLEKAIRKLNTDGLIKLASAHLDENITKTRISETDLIGRGLDVDAVVAYNKYRETMDNVFNYLNTIREAQGKKPITKEEAYMSSRWEGDFRQPIHDANGKLVWMIGGNSKRSVRQQMEAVLKQFPDLKPGDVGYQKSTRKGVDAHQAYRDMVDLLGADDPTVQKIKAWADEKAVIEGRNMLGQEKHFEHKAGVRGFLGDRPVNTFDGKFDAKKESLAQLQASIDYAKNAYAWGEMQLAMMDLKKIINDEELLKTQPRNMAWARDYVLTNLGMNDSAVSKAIDDTLRSAGISPHSIVKGVNEVKGLWVTQKLLGAGHYAANLLQGFQAIPHLTDISSKYGGNPLIAIGYGLGMGATTGFSHTLNSILDAGSQNTTLYKAGKAAGLSDFDLRAVKYAEDNNITTRSVYDESPIDYAFSKTGKAKRTATQIIAAPETFLRSVAFMTYAKMLETSGKFKNDLDLFRVAEEHVNASMGDYRGGERAMGFDKMGSGATLVNTFSTFPINYFNQWSWASREAGRGNIGPFVTMMATQYLLAGAMGVPGFADTDNLWNWIKDSLKDSKPEWWAKVKNIDLKELVMKAGGEVSLYGAPSVLSGTAMTSRVSAPAGSEMTGTPVAPFVDMFNMGGNLLSAATSPTDTQKWAQFAHSIAPVGAQSYLENTLFRDLMSVPAKRDGVEGRLVGKPTDMAARTGQVFRTPEQEAKRTLGLRAQSEQVEKDFAYKAQKKELDTRAVIRDLPKRIYNQLRNGNMDKARDYAQLYTQLSGKPLTNEQFTNLAIRENTTGAERMMLNVTTVEGLVAAKRLKQLLDEQKATAE